MLTIHNGIIFIDGQACDNPEKIGCALLDFAETTTGDKYALVFKDCDIVVCEPKK